MVELKQRLGDAVVELSVDLPQAGQDLLLKYLAQMQRWNRTYNLTAIRDPEQMLIQHVIDSLAIIQPMRDVLQQERAVIVDVGSGAGLPGVVVAAACPGWVVHCVDAVEKKMAFVRQMSGALGLKNLHAHHGRVETMEPKQADIVVSRAFASLLDFATLSGAHAAKHGQLLAMKGRHPEEEINALQQQGQWKVRASQPLKVPGLDAQRCLVWLSRQGNT